MIKPTKNRKRPIKAKAYGVINHLPGSRVQAREKYVHRWQYRACCCGKGRRSDIVIVQEKLDGSCCAVVNLFGKLYAIQRSGYDVASSPYKQHQMFGAWVRKNEERFKAVLRYNGERIIGEWLAQAHGTKYDLGDRDPWAPFDIMLGNHRLQFKMFMKRVMGVFEPPRLIHIGRPCPIEKALALHARNFTPCEEIEGLVYRVERRGNLRVIAKYVRPDKVDGKYLPEVTGKRAVWNWTATTRKDR